MQCRRLRDEIGLLTVSSRAASPPPVSPCACSRRSRAERPRRVSVMSWLPNQGPPVLPPARPAAGAQPAVPGEAAGRARRPQTAPAEAEAEPYRRRDRSCGRGSRSAAGRAASGVPDWRPAPDAARPRRRGARPRTARSTVAGACSPRTRPRRSASVSASKDAGKAAQCSRSAARRRSSPNRAQRGPRSPRHSAASHASASCTRWGSSQGSEVPISRWSYDAAGVQRLLAQPPLLARGRASRGPPRPGRGPPGCRPSAAGRGRSRAGSSSGPRRRRRRPAAAKARSASVPSGVPRTAAYSGSAASSSGERLPRCWCTQYDIRPLENPLAATSRSPACPRARRRWCSSRR